MNKNEMVNSILDLSDAAYIRGVAEVAASYETMKELQEAALLDMEASYADGPTMSQIMEFMDKYHNRDVELRLLVVDPKREDFRINIKAVSIAPEQARINNDKDMLFWMDFMNLGKMGCVTMVEDSVQISWEWFNG